MATKIFVNLSVKNLNQSVSFFTHLGFERNPQFSNESCACMAVSEDIYIMLLVEPFFKTFTKKEIADATKSTEAILCLSANSREEVDKLADAALVAGGAPANEVQDHGFMYGRSFQDPDGHLWEVMYMDFNAFSQAQESTQPETAAVA